MVQRLLANLIGWQTRRYLIRDANKGEPGALAELGRIYAGGNSRVFKQDYEEAYYCFSLCLKNKTKDPEDQQEWKEVEKSRDYIARKLTSSQLS